MRAGSRDGDQRARRAPGRGAPPGPCQSALASASKPTTKDASSLEAVIAKRADILVSYELGETDLAAALAGSDDELTRRDAEVIAAKLAMVQ